MSSKDYDCAVVVKKGRWSKMDDQRLRDLVHKEPDVTRPKWVRIAKAFKFRSGKQCRERWENHLKRGIKKRKFGHEESEFILREVEKVYPETPKWANIAKQLKSATPLMVRNHVNNFLKRVETHGSTRRRGPVAG
ncbi:2499_t:CDS:2, partial [Funneliformis caledonium]